MRYFVLALLLASASAAHAAARPFNYSFGDFAVGTAEYADGPTGTTVFAFKKAVKAAVDTRGGAAATRESSSIEPLNTWGMIDALVLAGGSTYGLDAASGVMRELLKARGNAVTFDAIPSVP